MGSAVMSCDHYDAPGCFRVVYHHLDGSAFTYAAGLETELDARRQAATVWERYPDEPEGDAIILDPSGIEIGRISYRDDYRPTTYH